MDPSLIDGSRGPWPDQPPGQMEFRGKDKYVPSQYSLITRDQWGAKPFKEGMEYLPLPVKKVAFQCNTNVANVCNSKEDCIKIVREIQREHMEEKGLPDISYNFIIGDDCNVYEGRGWKHKPALYDTDREKYNDTIEIGYIGVDNAKFLHWDMFEAYEWLRDRALEYNYIVPNIEEIDFCDKEEDMEGLAEVIAEMSALDKAEKNEAQS